MLYIFGGLPGTGKTALARLLAQDQKAVYIRIDTIEQVIRETAGVVNGPEGYAVAYRLAEDNLRLGMNVVADSVNPLQITRTAWRDAATRAGDSYIEIEVVCSEEAEHRTRVQTRSTDIAGFRLPTWEEVKSREYEPWDGEHIIIDTAGKTIEQSARQLRKMLGFW